MDEALNAKNVRSIIIYSICDLILIIIIQGLGVIETKYRSYIESLLSS